MKRIGTVSGWTRTFGPLEIAFEWDCGPDLTITFFGRRTHIIGLWWSAYPVLGGAKPYTIADLYRDSPTTSPFSKMVDKGEGVS